MSAAFRTDEADPPPAAARPSSGHYEAVVQQVREAKGDCCYTCTNCCDLEKRANHKRMLIFHRTSALSFWFAMLVLGIAFILGAMIKRANIENPAAWDPSDLTNLNTQNIDIYDMLYWITFCSWSGRWYIQAILNFTRGRTIGLSVNYVMWSFLAGVCNALAVVVSKATDRSIASFDTRSGPIDSKLIFYSVNGVIAPLIVLLQCWRYDGWNNQTPSAMVCGTTLMALIFTGIYMFVNMDIIGDKNGSTMAISRWIYGCEIFAIFCSIICFIPQFNMSKQFQIVIGVDIIHLFFQLLGACSLFCLIFFVTLQKNDYKVDSYATFRDVITVEVRQIVQSVFIIIAVLLLFIQLLWYWKMPTPDEIIEKINESKKDLNANARQHRQLHNVTNGGRGGRGGRGNASAGRGGRGTGSSGRGRGSPRTSTVSSPSVASSNNIRTSQPSTPPVLNARNLALNNPSGAVAFSANGTPTHSVLPVGSNGRRTSIATPGTPGAEAHSAAIPRWKCHICTFSNEAGNFFCLMCETQMEVNNPTPANGANV